MQQSSLLPDIGLGVVKFTVKILGKANSDNGKGM